MTAPGPLNNPSNKIRLSLANVVKILSGLVQQYIIESVQSIVSVPLTFGYLGLTK
jgi:hypothetical protein